jgi:hypothetical protein
LDKAWYFDDPPASIAAVTTSTNSLKSEADKDTGSTMRQRPTCFPFTEATEKERRSRGNEYLGKDLGVSPAMDLKTSIPPSGEVVRAGAGVGVSGMDLKASKMDGSALA